MSELSKPTALVVIDVQGAMMDDYPDDPSPFRKDEVLANIGTMLDNARAAGSKVIFARHVETKYPLMSPGHPAFEVHPAIAPLDGETVINKTACDSFCDTDLEPILREAGVTHLVTCGMQTDFCVDSATRSAMHRGFNVTLATDAHFDVGQRRADGGADHRPPQQSPAEPARSWHRHRRHAIGRDRVRAGRRVGYPGDDRRRIVAADRTPGHRCPGGRCSARTSNRRFIRPRPDRREHRRADRKARSAGARVIYIQHHDQVDPALRPGRPGFAIRAAIAPQPDETVIVKRICDTFTGTNLEQVLREAGIERLVTCGIQSDFCVDAATRGAMNRGFEVTLAADAHTTWDNGILTAEQIIAHVNATLPNMSGPARALESSKRLRSISKS